MLHEQTTYYLHTIVIGIEELLNVVDWSLIWTCLQTGTRPRYIVTQYILVLWHF